MSPTALLDFARSHRGLENAELPEITADDDLALRFDGAEYPSHMRVVDRRLTWSVPEEIALARGVDATYESTIRRWAMGGVELWAFPKSSRGPDRHALVLLDREIGVALSVEVDTRHGASAAAHSVRARRGAIDRAVDYRALRSFPADQDDPRAIRIDFGDISIRMRVGAGGGVERFRIGRETCPARGTVLRARDLSVLPWRAADAAGVVLWSASTGDVRSFASSGESRLAVRSGVLGPTAV